MDQVSFGAHFTLGVTYRQNIPQSRLEEVSQLLLGNEFKQRWFQWVPTDVVEKFHVKNRVTAVNG
jgi:hypothetical protein